MWKGGKKTSPTIEHEVELWIRSRSRSRSRINLIYWTSDINHRCFSELCEWKAVNHRQNPEQQLNDSTWMRKQTQWNINRMISYGKSIPWHRCHKRALILIQNATKSDQFNGSLFMVVAFIVTAHRYHTSTTLCELCCIVSKVVPNVLYWKHLSNRRKKSWFAEIIVVRFLVLTIRRLHLGYFIEWQNEQEKNIIHEPACDSNQIFARSHHPILWTISKSKSHRWI